MSHVPNGRNPFIPGQPWAAQTTPTTIDDFNTVNQDGCDVLAYLGRFQPFHLGHQHVIEQGLRHGARKIVIGVGSANRPRTFRNPFTYEERVDMIRAAMGYDPRLVYEPINDATYNNEGWTAQVQAAVAKHIRGNQRVGLLGYSKDASSYYLKMFPKWREVSAQPYRTRTDMILDASIIRNTYFAGDFIDHMYEDLLHPATVDFLKRFRSDASFLTDNDLFRQNGKIRFESAFDLIYREYDYLKTYHKQWAAAPYPPTFVTVDNIVIQSGHILLVKRKAMPGEGLLALPGGFIGKSEDIMDASLRELVEETKIKVDERILRRCMGSSVCFADPNRSQRGRTITFSHLYHLDPGPLPKVRGSDDAHRVGTKWYPLNEVRDPAFDALMFEDHSDVIKKETSHL